MQNKLTDFMVLTRSIIVCKIGQFFLYAGTLFMLP